MIELFLSPNHEICIKPYPHFGKLHFRLISHSSDFHIPIFYSRWAQPCSSSINFPILAFPIPT